MKVLLWPLLLALDKLSAGASGCTSVMAVFFHAPFNKLFSCHSTNVNQAHSMPGVHTHLRKDKCFPHAEQGQRTGSAAMPPLTSRTKAQLCSPMDPHPLLQDTWGGWESPWAGTGAQLAENLPSRALGSMMVRSQHSGGWSRKIKVSFGYKVNWKPAWTT